MERNNEKVLLWVVIYLFIYFYLETNIQGGKWCLNIGYSGLLRARLVEEFK